MFQNEPKQKEIETGSDIISKLYEQHVHITKITLTFRYSIQCVFPVPGNLVIFKG